VAAKKSKARIIRTIPENQYWDWINDVVKVESSGHFPDTVMVDYQGKKFEAYLKDLTEVK
jgi:hypothetical protein